MRKQSNKTECETEKHCCLVLFKKSPQNLWKKNNFKDLGEKELFYVKKDKRIIAMN